MAHGVMEARRYYEPEAMVRFRLCPLRGSARILETGDAEHRLQCKVEGSTKPHSSVVRVPC